MIFRDNTCGDCHKATSGDCGAHDKPLGWPDGNNPQTWEQRPRTADDDLVAACRLTHEQAAEIARLQRELAAEREAQHATCDQARAELRAMLAECRENWSAWLIRMGAR